MCGQGGLVVTSGDLDHTDTSRGEILKLLICRSEDHSLTALSSDLSVSPFLFPHFNYNPFTRG